MFVERNALSMKLLLTPIACCDHHKSRREMATSDMTIEHNNPAGTCNVLPVDIKTG